MSAETEVIVSLTDPVKVEPMADPIDLPSNVASAMLTESIGSVTQTARNSRDVASLASGALQAGIQMGQNTLALTVAGRTVSGVVATPIAGPTEQIK